MAKSTGTCCSCAKIQLPSKVSQVVRWIDCRPCLPQKICADQVEYGTVVRTIVGGQVNGCRQIVALQDRPGDLIEAIKTIIESQNNTFFWQRIRRESRQAFR